MRFYNLSNLRDASPAAPEPHRPLPKLWWGALLIIVVTLTGCAGPTRARYKELLAECREQNREHLRMFHEYAKSVELCGGKHPEQSHGVAEMGLGGF